MSGTTQKTSDKYKDRFKEGGRYSKESIDRVIERANILEVCKEFIHDLKKTTGGSWIAKSPKKPDEKHDSFVVTPALNIFKDFSQGPGGPPLVYLMEYQNMSWFEAVKWLSQFYNMPLEREGVFRKTDADYQKEVIHMLNEFACGYFQDMLQSPEGLKALAYLELRGYSEENIKRNRLGFAPDSWDGLIKAAIEHFGNEIKLGDTFVTTKTALNMASLTNVKEKVVEKNQGNKNTKHYYCAFRNRIMFPWIDEYNKVIGFGGRIYEVETAEQTEAKLNGYVDKILAPTSNIAIERNPSIRAEVISAVKKLLYFSAQLPENHKFDIPLLDKHKLILFERDNKFMVEVQDASGEKTAKSIVQIAHEPPKYLNSRENVVFQKGSIFYGINHAYKRIRETSTVYIQEGYTDINASQDAGVLNTVGTGGTALHANHAKRLFNYLGPGGKIVVLFDGDQAGQKAIDRAIDKLLNPDTIVMVVQLPKKLDPDEFISTQGVEAYREYLAKNEIDFLHFKVKFLLGNKEQNAYKKAEAIRSIVSSLARLANPTLIHTYIAELSELVGINVEVLRSELENHYRKLTDRKNDVTKQRMDAITDGFIPKSDDEAYLRLMLGNNNRKVVGGKSMIDIILEFIDTAGVEIVDDRISDIIASVRSLRAAKKKVDRDTLSEELPELTDYLSKFAGKKIPFRLAELVIQKGEKHEKLNALKRRMTKLMLEYAQSEVDNVRDPNRKQEFEGAIVSLTRILNTN